MINISRVELEQPCADDANTGDARTGDGRRGAEGAANKIRREALRIESRDWVNVVAVVAEDDQPSGEISGDSRLVLIKQWRFGSDCFTLEIPGGIVEDGEDPAEAARRELLEETGFRCDRVVALGVVQPNPALFDNLCHLYLAPGATRVGEPEGDGEEQIEVSILDLGSVRQLIKEGAIQHALVLCAFQALDRSLDSQQP